MSKKGRIGDRYRKVTISKENVKQQNKKQYAKIAFLALFLFVVTLGGSYALFTTTKEGTKQTEVVSGTLTIEYEDKNEISLNNTAPLSNEEGLNTEGYTFTIKNTGTLNGKYTISLEEKDNNTLDKNYIKYSIREEGKEWSTPSLLSSGLIIKENVLIESKKDTTYELKIWLDENAPNEVQGKTYSAKVVVSTVQANTTQLVTTNPIIEINGEKIVKIEENTEYVDAGISSIKSTENINKENITTRYEYYDGTSTTTVERIDTSKVGIYYIYYEIEDSKGNKGITTRVVNVYKKDTNIPTILLKGENLISLDYNEEYIEAGYTATDIEDLDLTNKVIVEGRVNKEVSGTYIIKYIVIDSSGNTSSVTREVIVNKKNSEISLVATSEENENITSTITIEGETENNKMYYAVTNTSEKPSDSEYKEMDLVTELSNTKSISPSKLNTIKESSITKLSTLKKFKKEIEIVKNGTYYIFIKDDKNNIETEEVKVTNIDETKPVCEFSNTEYVGLNKTIELTLTCTDPADITNEKILKEYFEVDNKISIEIGSSTKVEKGYSYLVTVTGKQEGISTLKLLSNKITDKVGNSNEIVSKEIKVTNIEVETTEVSLDLSKTKTHQINVTGTNQGSISYTSSDESIATVDSKGLITGVSPGITIIKVTEANGQVSKEIKVTVVKTITIEYEKGEGVSSITSTKTTCEIKDGSKECEVTLPSITASTGYTVSGWYEGTIKVGESEESYKATKDITLTAKATPNDYVITYDYNYLPNNIMETNYNTTIYAGCCTSGGTISSNKTTTDSNGKMYSVTSANQGWYFPSITKLTVGTTYTYQFEAKASTGVIPTIGSEQGGNKTFNIGAEWKRYTHTFTATNTTYSSFVFYYWYGNDERTLQIRNLQMRAGSLNTTTSTLKYTTTLGDTVTTPTRSGYTFDGWYTEAIGGTKVDTTTAVPSKNTTYYAHWVANKYYFDVNPNSGIESFDITMNGGTKATGLKDYYQQQYTGTEAIITNVKAKEGYTYTGYTVSGSMSKMTGSSNETIKLKLGASNGAVALTGTINSYKVTYDATTNGGTTTATSKTLNYNSDIDLTPTASKTGYTFKGWNTNKDATTGLTSLKLGASDVTLYAIFVDETAPSKPTITNSSNGGWAQSAVVTLTSTDSGSGLDRYEWYENGAWTTRAIDITDGVGKITYTAERDLTIRFRAVDKDGNISEEATTKVRIDTTKPSCSWTGTTTVNYNGTTTRTLTCTDTGSGLSSQTLSTSNFTVSNTNGSVTSVSTPTAVTNGYKYTLTVKGIAAGSFTVSLKEGIIKDAATNTNAVTASGSITVNKVAATNPTLTAYTGTYDGNSHTITVSGGSGGTIQYSTDNSTWSTTKPTRTNAGTTTVYVRVLGDANHNTTSSVSANITLAQATPTLTLSATSGKVNKGSTVTFTEKGSVAGSFSNVSGTTSVATVSPASYSSIAANTEKTVTITGVSNGTSKITVTFTPTSSNYKAVTATYTVTGYLVATTGSCASLTYNGSSRTLASGGTGVTYSNNTRTSAGSQTVTIAANSGYRFSDGTTSKTLSCSIAKATPTLTLGSTAGTVVAGKTMTFTEKANIAGKFTNTSSSTSVATVSPTSNSTAVTANTNQTVTVTGVASGTSTITVTFTPTDTTNYNTITSSSTAKKTYTANVSKSAAIPTASSYCKTGLVYNGASQTLTNTAGTGYTFSGNTRTSAGSQTVTATLASGYRWSDNTTAAKTFSCSIGQATPTVTLSASSGTVVAGNSITFTEKANVAGTFTNSSGATGVATISPASVTATANTAYTETIKGVAAGSSTITVKFTPTSTNYKSVTKTYTATVQTAVAKNVTGSTTTYYSSLQAAVDASTSSTTTTLLQNTTEDVWITSAITANINYNGKTQTGLFISNHSSANVTLFNGYITNSSDRAVYNAGTMIIDNMTLTGTCTSYDSVVFNATTGTLYLNNGTKVYKGSGVTYGLVNNATTVKVYIYNSTDIATINGPAVAAFTLYDSSQIEVNLYGYDSASSVQFPTWTNNNGQDDIQWYSGTKGTYAPRGTYWSARFPISNHNSETGTYITHYYINGSTGVGSLWYTY